MRRLDSARDFARSPRAPAEGVATRPTTCPTVPDRSTRFKRPVLLIVGCGDVGLRVARLLAGRWRVLALTSTVGRVAELRSAGVTPLRGDLNDAASLARLAGLADAVLHLAPPPATGSADPRTRNLAVALARSPRLRRLVYGSTSGVYGDRAGAPTDETAPLRPASERARRRVDAEMRLRHFGRASGAVVTILRIPGIYALDRAGGDPRERVRRGTPVLAASDDVHTGHIHADDLARACVAALHRGRPQRAVNVADDSGLRMGDYFDVVADRFGLARPPRLARADAAELLSPLQMSFLGESRRLVNARMKHELRLALRYATVTDGLGVPASALRE
jgi:nucleoside-diphosphate-sugar epimerase